MLCALIGECIKEKIYNIDFIPIELNARRENERYKRLDVLAEADGKKINVELNSSYDEAGRVRNLNYYFSFCSQYTKVTIHSLNNKKHAEKSKLFAFFGFVVTNF